jgi:oligoendopeptidase F
LNGLLALSPGAVENVWARPVVTTELTGTFLPNRLIFFGWEMLSQFFEQLKARPVSNEQEFEQYVKDLGDLEAQLHDAYQNLNVLCALFPNDPRTSEFQRNLQNHEYLWDVARQTIYERLSAMPWISQVERFGRLAAVVNNLAEVFHPQWYSLQNSDRWLCDELQQVESRVNTERENNSEEFETEQQYWRSEQRRLLKHAPELDRVISKLISVRNEKARSVGCGSFADLCLRRDDSLEYTAHDLEILAEAVLEYFSPLAREVNARSLRSAGIRRWRPWSDTETDFLYPDQLNSQEVLEGALAAFLGRLSPEFSALYRDNRYRSSLDLFTREGKISNPFVSSFTRPDGVFLSTNLDGSAASLTEVFHETAHLLESFAALSQPFYYYRNPAPDTSEAIALAMELIGTRHYDLFYTDGRKEAALLVLGEHITMVVNYAWETLFELWLYREGGDASATTRAHKWNALEERSGSLIDWSGCEKYRQVEYLNDLNRYLSPFNSTKYLVGAIALFQVYLNYLRDPSAATRQILDTMSAGDSLHLFQLFEKLGAPLRFDRLHILGLSERMRDVWGRATSEE